MKVCLITNTHISYNPRLLKEADSLHNAGHNVRVVSISNNEQKTKYDNEILKTRSWKCVRLNFSGEDFISKVRWLKSGIRTKFYLQLSKYSFSCNIPELAFSRYLPETLKTVLNEPADLYIAHNLQALPIAAVAAKLTQGLLGFDIEDFHIGEDSEIMYDPHISKIKRYIMEKYIKRCNYTSAPSENMADELVKAFDIARPTVLYNVFPLQYLSVTDQPEESSLDKENNTVKPYCYSAYWFSQEIGLDRGIQDFIKAMPLLVNPVNLHLRGYLPDQVKNTLLELAKQINVVNLIHFHPPIYAEDLVQDAAHYDFGLALEHPVSKNRLLTITNKLFVYLLAGNAIIATKTPGQREILDNFPEVGIQYEAGDYKSLAAQINNIFHEKKLQFIRQSSKNLGRSKFNWDSEQKKFLSIISDLAYTEMQKKISET